MLIRHFGSLAVSLAFLSFAIADERPTISVDATATIKTVPDMVLLSFGVESSEETVTKSAESTSKKIADIQKFLRREGLEARDIRTERLSLTPVFPDRLIAKVQTNASPFGPNQQAALPNTSRKELTIPKPVGFRATRFLRVTIRDVESFEAIYRGLLESGVNRINSVSTQSSKIENLRAEARLQAMAIAKEKAEAMAKVLGANLKSIITIREEGGGAYPPNLSIAVSADPFAAPFGSSRNSTEFNTGEITVSSSVSVVFELKDTEL